MNTHDLTRELRRRVPEFSPDPQFVDLPYVTWGEFGQFLRNGLVDTEATDIVRRCVEIINEVFHVGDGEVQNIVETSVFEVIADDPRASSVIRPLLDADALDAFNRIARWSASGTHH
jgi:hypothetical protein